jgi:transcriptional antiterminator Rof (Rho-off)
MVKKSMLQLGEERLAQEDVGTSPMTHDENLRANALALACRYYVETICKDGDLYREMIRDNRVLKPATYIGVIEVACSFEMFIRGELKKDADAVVGHAMDLEAQAAERKLAHEQHMKELDNLTHADREIQTAR